MEPTRFVGGERNNKSTHTEKPHQVVLRLNTKKKYIKSSFNQMFTDMTGTCCIAGPVIVKQINTRGAVTGETIWIFFNFGS